jgi:hypothetical protein
MNISKEADAEFLRLLKNEDSKRYENLMRNIPRGERMDEDQALTNFMLGLPTGQHRFMVIAGIPAPLALEVDRKMDFQQRPFSPATADRGGRPRKFKTDAERQKAHRKAELIAFPQNGPIEAGNHGNSTSYDGVL